MSLRVRSLMSRARPVGGPYIDQMRGGSAGQLPELGAPGLPDLAQQLHRGLDHRRQHAQHDDLRMRAGGAGALAQCVRVDQRARDVERRIAPRARQRRAGDEEDRRDAAMAGQADRALQQPPVGRVDAPALQPHARHLDVLLQRAALEGLAGVGQAERGDVPADQLGAWSRRAGVSRFSARQPL